MTKRRKVKIDPSAIVRIVGDGLIATLDSFGGAGVPVLILDTEHLPQLAEAIRVSSLEPDGDAVCQWGTAEGSVILNIELGRPLPTAFVIHFDLGKQGILVESALSARAVQLKSGSPGDSFKSTFSESGLVVEVPGPESFPPWPAVFIRSIMENYRRGGMKTVEARAAAEQAYTAMLSTARFHIPPKQYPMD